MYELITRHYASMQSYGIEKRGGLVIDEWGNWWKNGKGPSGGENLFEQQSTMLDAVVTALTLNIFNNNAEKILMANAAQLCNNLHALFLAGGDKLVTTPTYHIFDMYREHQGATSVRSICENGDVSVSASKKNGRLLVTLANLSMTKDVALHLNLPGINASPTAEGLELFSQDVHSHNTFDSPDTVTPKKRVFDLSEPFILKRASVVSLDIGM